MWSGLIWLRAGSRDFHHLEHLKGHLAGKQLVAGVDVTYWLQTLDTDLFYASLQVLLPE